MAYAYDPFLDLQDDEESSQGPSIAGSGQVTGGASAPVAAGAPTAGQPTRSDRYQNLSDYLKANEGQQFGQQFTNKVNSEISNASQAQKDAYDSFKGTVDSATVKTNADLLQGTINDPTSTAKDAQKSAEFKNQLNAEYKGPFSYEDNPATYQKAASATSRASDIANAATSEGGRFALLNDFFGRPQYTQGQKSLDNLLLQNDPTTKQGIEQAKQNANLTRSNLEAQKKGAADYAAKAAQDTTQTGDMYRQIFGVDKAGNKTDNGFYSGTLAATAADLDRKAMAGDRNYSTVTRALNNNLMGNLTQDLLDSYGIDRSYLTSGEGISNPQLDGRILDVNPGDYLSSNPGWDKNSNLSQADYDKIQALSSLLGQQNPYADPQTIANKNQYDFNDKGFVDAVFARDNQRVASLSNQDNIQSVINKGGTGGSFSYSAVKNAIGHAPSLQEVADYYQKQANNTKVVSPISQGIKDANQRVADAARAKITEINNAYNYNRRFN